MTRPPDAAAQDLDIDRLVLQYPSVPCPSVSGPRTRPIITVDTRCPVVPSAMLPSALNSAPAISCSASSIPDITSACTPPDTPPTYSAAESPQVAIFNSPLIPSRDHVEYVPQIHRRPPATSDDTNTQSENKPHQLRSPPTIPTLLPDTMPQGCPTGGTDFLEHPAQTYSTPAHSLSMDNTYVASPVALHVPELSLSSEPSTPSSVPISAPFAPPGIGVAPYLHPHTQSYAALASASSSGSIITPASVTTSPASKKRDGSPSRDSIKPTSPSAAKRRKMWVHTLEKNVFTADEISSLTAPARRTVYTASLEAHIDKLHNDLLRAGLFPASPEQLEPYHGLNSKTAKSMAAGLHGDIVVMRTRMASMQRAEEQRLREMELQAAETQAAHTSLDDTEIHHSDDSGVAKLEPNSESPKPRRSYVYPDVESAGFNADGQLSRETVS